MSESLSDDKHWIEIELFDEDDKPVPSEEYCVTLPDGVQARGYLDRDGFARVTGIEQPGLCKVTFPNLDKEAWQ